MPFKSLSAIRMGLYLLRRDRCWECGKAAPVGVCMGPHENYDHARAIAQGNVQEEGHGG